MRFHVLGVPHTATNKDYASCAFTQKVLNLCAMLTRKGHTVIHYGNELSKVECTENVVVTYKHDIPPPESSGIFDVNSVGYMKFHAITHGEIARRKQPGDFLCCMWAGHKQVADDNKDMITVECGIGYPDTHFAPFKVFESYAMLHAYRGLDAVAQATGNKWWYDVVIPNYYDPDDFEYAPKLKEDYILFLGNRSIGGEGKGIGIAIQIANRINRKLIIAGPGEITYDIPKNVDVVGFVSGDVKRRLLSRARAVLCPSLFVEPFCGVSVEAFFSGSPVISTDWGAFAENNLHGVTGYRCRTMEQFIWAINHIGRIDPQACRDWAMKNFTIARVANMYEEYFKSIAASNAGGGWYAECGTDMTWLNREYPQCRRSQSQTPELEVPSPQSASSPLQSASRSTTRTTKRQRRSPSSAG
jgi:glycosyltransferase involved in cell wall biosynthesis